MSSKVSLTKEDRRRLGEETEGRSMKEEPEDMSPSAKES